MRTAASDIKFLRQRTQFSCMATSLCSALFAYKRDVTEEEVNKVLGSRPLRGASWEELMGAAQYFGLRASLVVPSTVQQLKGWTDSGIPVIIAWNPENRPWSHASVVFDVEEKEGVFYIKVMDPNIPNPEKTVRVCHEDFFYDKWQEKGEKYLIRRPACALTEEVSSDGRQIAPSIPSSKGEIIRVASQRPGLKVKRWMMATQKIAKVDIKQLEKAFGPNEILMRMTLVFDNAQCVRWLRSTNLLDRDDKGAAVDLISAVCNRGECTELLHQVFAKIPERDKEVLVEALGGLHSQRRFAGQVEKMAGKKESDKKARWPEKMTPAMKKKWKEKHPDLAENAENWEENLKSGGRKKKASANKVALRYLLRSVNGGR